MRDGGTVGRSDGEADGWDFFVSYVQSDRAWAEWAAWQLEDVGYAVLLQAWDMTPGTSWPSLLDQAVRRARRTIAMVSAAYCTSMIVAVEWQAAFVEVPGGRGRKLLPVRLEDCPREGLLAQVAGVDLFDIAEPDARKRLVAAARLALSGGRAKPAAGPAMPAGTRTSSGPAGFPGRLWMLPPPAAPIVPRPLAEADLLEALLDPAAPVVGMTTGIQGEGGFGKTTLAQMVCSRPEVREAFRGGLLWTEVGQERDGAALTALIDDLVITLTGSGTGLSDPGKAAGALAELLMGRPRTLLVVDDIWRRSQLAPFLEIGRACQLLITTRRASTLPPTARSVIVEQMTDEEARDVLCAGIGELPDEVVARLRAVSGNWPLLLSLAASKLAKDVAEHAAPALAAEQLVLRLQGAGPATLDIGDERSRSVSVRQSVGASLSLLHPENQRRYLELSVFPEDDDVPVEVVGLLWQGSGGLDAFEADELCDRLFDLRLIRRRWTGSGAVIALHDVVRAHLRRELGVDGLRLTHQALLTGIRARLTAQEAPGAWWALPDGRASDYLTRRLAGHLLAAGQVDEAAAVARDLRWIAASIRRTSSTLTAENDLATVGGDEAPLLARALAQNAHLLTGPPPPGGLGPTLAACAAAVPGLATSARAYTQTLARPYLGFGWSTDRKNPTQLRAFAGHTAPVGMVVFSPDGRLLATGASDGTARLWDVATGVVRAVLPGYGGTATTVAFSPDGSTLATYGAEGTARLWDAGTGTERACLAGHDRAVNALVFSPEEILVATGGQDGTARLWDVVTGAERAAFTGHVGAVTTMAFSPDGRLLVTGGADRTARIWRPGATAEPVVLTGHAGSIKVVRFSPDGRMVVTGGYDRTVRLWDAATGDELTVITDYKGRVTGVTFSPDGRLLAVVGHARSVLLFDLATGVEHAILAGHTGGVSGAVFSPDGRVIATSSEDWTVRLWNSATGTANAILSGHGRPVNGLAFSPDGQVLATGSDDTYALIWDVADGADHQARGGHTHQVTETVFSRDGRLIATGSDDKTVRLWDVETGAEHPALDGYAGWGNVVAFSPNGRLLATDCFDNTVRLWDPASGAQRAVLVGHTRPISGAAFSPDGSLLATCSHDRTARVWDPEAGVERRALVGHSGRILTVLFSPDGQTIATGGAHGTVRLWDVATGADRAVLHGADRMKSRPAFSPDGRFLAVSGPDCTVQLWNVVTGAEKTVLAGHSGPVTGGLFSPVGGLFATSSADGTVRLWDAMTGVAGRVLTGHRGAVAGVAFSPHGELLASGGHDGTIRIWDVAGGVAVSSLRINGPISRLTWNDEFLCCAAGREVTILRCVS
ncbi:TIR domain-containing protein [Pseudofrankia inefficax]|uniref:NB-ARC domain protein n=1 Tax=Pseudofrankia inefficax (strain DSM 45817 / CECT 9037 / DDB 130130 / EuI1c) TaxID=298654 RepID=E3J7Y1_PSEI1|nr:TIR domain-containing protein [Pseudofrankia inefficax]ADP82029.1 NB-ARC domain protein [Pseudofrankia inefficax]